MRKFLLLLLTIVILVPAKAQGDLVIGRDKKVAVTIVPGVGLNLPHFTGGDSGIKFGMTAGANVGVGVGLRFLKRKAYTPVEDGILGVYGGIAFEMGGTTEAAGGGISMFNLGIPVLVQAYPVPWLYLELGPEFFINMGNLPNTTTIGNMQINIEGHKANDIKIAFGAGAKIKQFGLGVRYLIGLSNFAPSAPWKCNILQLNFTYHIPLGKSDRSPRLKL